MPLQRWCWGRRRCQCLAPARPCYQQWQVALFLPMLLVVSLPAPGCGEMQLMPQNLGLSPSIVSAVGDVNADRAVDWVSVSLLPTPTLRWSVALCTHAAVSCKDHGPAIA